jgi:MYXO-CTERM domain-containing protein
MVFTHRLVGGLLIAFLVAAPRLAAADDSNPYGRTPLSQKEKLRWNVLMRDGKKLVEGEKWVEASAKFSEAIKLDPHPEPFLWKGFSEEKLGHLVVAKAIYAEAQTAAKNNHLTQETGQAEEALAEIAKKVPRIVLRLPDGVQATVSIDGATIAVTPEGADVNPGARSVDVSATAREPYHADVTAAEGEVYTLDVPLPRLAPEVVKPAAPELPPVQGPRGCGPCSVGNAGDARSPLMLAALAALVLAERRRNKPRRP